MVIKGHLDTLRLTKMPCAASLGCRNRRAGVRAYPGVRQTVGFNPSSGSWKGYVNLDTPVAAANLLEAPTCNHPRCLVPAWASK
jgi:hypothetical protein